jgi:hypothetical protein
MSVGPRPEERRDEQMQTHVAQVWADPIAHRDPEGLFHLGAACLDLADATADPDRRALLASVALSLLAYAGRNDGSVGSRIERLCERERARAENQAETARAIAELAAALRASP